ncbi:uncharacterized protein LOC135826253 [Sycon ciliatum]|uniref:uncharacterized protein LOC135826253 n=1 Tax=Sycon ciliatum TaxID=27933 RepID=UPI0031F6DAE2
MDEVGLKKTVVTNTMAFSGAGSGKTTIAGTSIMVEYRRVKDLMRKADNRGIVLASPLFAERQYLDLLRGHAQEQNGTFCKGLFELLASLVTDDESATFQFRLTQEDISEAVKMLTMYKTDPSVVDSVCNFLDIALNRPSPIDDDQQVPIVELCPGRECIEICRSFVNMMEHVDRTKVKNNAIKRFTTLILHMRGIIQETGAMQAITELNIDVSLSKVLCYLEPSRDLVEVCAKLLKFFVTDDTLRHARRQGVSAATVHERAGAALATCVEGEDEQWADNPQMRTAVRELLSALGYVPASSLVTPAAADSADVTLTAPTSAAAAAATSTSATAAPAAVSPAAAPAAIATSSSDSSTGTQSTSSGAKRGTGPSNKTMHEATNRTFSSGWTRVRRIRISLCGQFGTGKTSLADSLKNKQFVHNMPSTPVLNVDHSNVLHGAGNLKDWDFGAALLCAPDILDHAEDLEKKRQQEHEQQQQPAGSTDHEAAPSSAELTQTMIDVILANQELMRDIGEEEVVASIWDCGGQSIFSSLQHFLMGEDYVIYILC